MNEIINRESEGEGVEYIVKFLVLLLRQQVLPMTQAMRGPPVCGACCLEGNLFNDLSSLTLHLQELPPVAIVH